MFNKISLALAAFFILIFSFNYFKKDSTLPTIAIANYGPHSSLQDVIDGITEELKRLGYEDKKNINLEISDVNFDAALISQMISKLKSHHPKVFVALTTPVAQSTKNIVKDTPVIFSAITNPNEAGLSGIAGTSDKQDLGLLIKFAKKLLPQSKTIGLLYATGEANDTALLKMLGQASEREGMKLLAIPVDQTRDIPIRMQAFKGNVDFIYVGTSGPIQPALPTIAHEADKMHIPVFNMGAEAVEKNLVLGSYGVEYKKVGENTAYIVKRILDGENPNNIPPIYPEEKDHKGYISRKKATSLGITISSNLDNTTIIE